MSGPARGIDLEAYVASLAKDHDDLQARIRTVSHTAQSKDKRVNLHAHFLAFRDGSPTVVEFVDVLSDKVASFCLHRKYIKQIQHNWPAMPANKILESAARLHQQALDLFKKASRNTNRNGEFGELITFLLIELVLKAPQFVAKMSLKTSSQMPIHGSDGIHLGYDAGRGALQLYWGESKCYASVKEAISNAVISIKENLEHNKMAHELFLIDQYFDLAGFPDQFREAILSFLNPYDENYNKRTDISVMFIGFNFPGFAKLNGIKPEEIESKFTAELCASLKEYAEYLDSTLSADGVKDHAIEVFFMPVPSISDLRKLFQDKIGWS